MDRFALELLRRLEAAELRLLTWGCVDGVFTESEVVEIAQKVVEDLPGATGQSEWDPVQALLDAHWLWRTPDGRGYRTRMAEAVRLFSRLRQLFPKKPWRSAPNLVADFRLLVQPRRFAQRTIPGANLATALRAEGLLSANAETVVRALLGTADSQRLLAQFQFTAALHVLRAAKQRASSGTIVCAGTGSGKTLAFYLPALVAIADASNASDWTKCFAVYPRNELLKDQLREALANSRRVRSAMSPPRRPISLGALYVAVPKHSNAIAYSDSGWKQTQWRKEAAWECPFVRCPDCDAAPQMVWTERERKTSTERLRCPTTGCNAVVEGTEVRLTRQSLLAAPPDILFTSTEMLNSRLSSTEYHRLFGIDVPENHRPLFVLLDEVHSYEGTHGAHVALLLRRWQALSKARPHFVGLSATLEDAQRFFADLTGVPVGSVTEVSPSATELEESGAQYQLALRGDAASGASLLSTSIQSLMLLRRILGADPDDCVSGSRAFAFTDNLDVVNRLFHNLANAEGRSYRTLAPRPGAVPLASLRASGPPDATQRFDDGQSWDLVEAMGHSLVGGNRLDVRRTSSQDPGVDARADVVVATSALEVGLDDRRVGGVLQHKAPRSAAGFLQRKGRAGRVTTMRPWTVVVLSDFGRDRSTYESYDQLFSPILAPRYLPLANRVILRMQATYALFDWLVRRPGQPTGSWAWSDLSHPPDKAKQVRDVGKRPAEGAAQFAARLKRAGEDDVQLAARQKHYLESLRALLKDEGTRSDFARFVSRSLAVDDDDALVALLWEPPRGVLLEAVPTLIRRLERQWQRALGGTEPRSPYGPPLPEFVQKSLFGDLLVPEVTILAANLTGDSSTMLIGQALREFAPGRVSRRFGTTGDISHWVDPGPGPELDINSFCGPEDRELLGSFPVRDGANIRTIRAFRPRAIRVVAPSFAVLPSSTAQCEWRTQVLASEPPHVLDLPTGAASTWSSLLGPLRFHTHHLGNPVQVRRLTLGARVTERKRRETREFDLHFTEGDDAVGLGFVADVDAVEVRFTFPRTLSDLVAKDARLLRGLRVARMRDVLRMDESLTGVVNQFQRDWLVEALAAAVGLEAVRSDSPLVAALNAVLENRAVTSLSEVLSRMSLWSADGDHDDDSDVGDEVETDAQEAHAAQAPASQTPRRLSELLDALADPTVTRALASAATALTESPSEAWNAWLQAKLKATVGAALLDAICELVPQVDTESLLVELDAHIEKPSDADDCLWITETTLGGGGALESFYRAYANDPRRFFRLVEASLGASDREQVAIGLEDVLSASASGPGTPMVVALAATRSASNYAQTLEAVRGIRHALSSRGVVPGPSLLVSLFARILRPNSSSATDEYLAVLIDEWNKVEGRLGIELEMRTYALAKSEDARLETALHLDPPTGDPGENAMWRWSVLRGVLWPRGSQLRKEALRVNNPFAKAPDADRLLARLVLMDMRVPVEVTELGWFEAVSEQLCDQGLAELRAPVSQLGALLEALLRIGREPVDTGGLRVFARLSGTRREPSGWIATLELPEAFQ